MSFTGSVPQQARLLISEVLKGVDRKTPIYVLCSGNFTIDRIAHSMGFKVHSNDVSIYSKMIADFVMGNKTEFSIKNTEIQRIYDKWPKNKFKDVTFIMYLLKLGEFSKRKNDFEEANWKRLVDYNLKYYESTCAKLEASESLNFEIESYYHGDMLDRCIEAKKGIAFSFAPTYKGGYEKLYNFIEETLDYDRASYEIFDSGKAGELYKSWLDNQDIFIYTDKDWKEVNEYLHGKIVMPPPKKSINFYSSIGERNFLMRDKDKLYDTPKYVTMPQNYDFSKIKEVSALVVKTSEVNYYKMKFMSAKVDYTTGGDFGIMFFADGYLFGMATFSKFLSNLDEIFVQSDFIPPIDFPRVSKLVIMMLKTNDVKRLLTRQLKHSYKSLKTSVFTEKPESMKYRGAWKKIERREKDNKIIYGVEFNEMTIHETYELWLKRTLKSIKDKEKSTKIK